MTSTLKRRSWSTAYTQSERADRMKLYRAHLARMRSLGFTCQAVAEELGYSKSYISGLIKGRRTPPDNVLAALRSLLVKTLAGFEDATRAEADRLAAERRQIEAEAIAA